jgi:hypothetical protein
MPTTENTPKADTGFSMPGMPTNFGFGGMVCVYLYACAPRHSCVSARQGTIASVQITYG